MPNKYGLGPEFDGFAERAENELVPKIEGSNIFVSIVPPNGKCDIKFALELGLAIMYNKPIVAVIQPGRQIPEKLARVIDRFVDLDINEANATDKLMDVLDDMTKGE